MGRCGGRGPFADEWPPGRIRSSVCAELLPQPNSKRAETTPARPASGCSYIPLHTRTSRHDLSRFREGSSLSSTIRKERRHENVTSNRPCSSSADDRHRNRGPDFKHRRRWRGRTRQVVRGGRVPTEADTVRNASWVVSCDRPAGSPSIMEVRYAATDDEL